MILWTIIFFYVSSTTTASVVLHLISYNVISNRLQYVQLQNHNSSQLIITHGVPQGSVLGPLLFLVYINDICNSTLKSLPLLFADDTTLTYAPADPHQLVNDVNSDLSKLHTWLTSNKLTLNTNKSNFILFQNHKRLTIDPNISINNPAIKRTGSTKLLGVEIDSKLSCKPHITNLRKKIASSCFMLRKIRWKISSETALKIYNTTVESYLLPH